jgi:hypothetical protein
MFVGDPVERGNSDVGLNIDSPEDGSLCFRILRCTADAVRLQRFDATNQFRHINHVETCTGDAFKFTEISEQPVVFVDESDDTHEYVTRFTRMYEGGQLWLLLVESGLIQLATLQHNPISPHSRTGCRIVFKGDPFAGTMPLNR